MGRQEPQASRGDGSETCSAQGAKRGGSAVAQVTNTPRCSEQAWGSAKASADAEGAFTTRAGWQKLMYPFPSGISALQVPAPSSSSWGSWALMTLCQAGGTRKQRSVAMAT